MQCRQDPLEMGLKHGVPSHWGTGSLHPSKAPSSWLVSEFHRPGFNSQLCPLVAVWMCILG